jgi:hypothetical protein
MCPIDLVTTRARVQLFALGDFLSRLTLLLDAAAGNSLAASGAAGNSWHAESFE